MKKKIYFADLTYHSNVLASDYIPLGCGYVAAYANKMYGDKFDIQIFRHQEELFKVLENKPPDIFAGSCYVWNKNLVLRICKFIKKEFPECLTVLGGPAFPLDVKRQKLFFSDNPYVDFFLPYDGEIPFANFLDRYLRVGDKIKSDEMPIDGCLYLSKDNQLLSGRNIKRPKELDIFVSPYLTGLFDRFLEDRNFSPMMQITRGCPFRCAYCWASNEQNRHIGFFSYERIKDELYYIAKMATKNNIYDLVFCDSNFGMYERDEKIVDVLYELQQKFDYPRLFFPNFGNGNHADLVKNCSKLRGVTYCFSTQSTDPKILNTVKRIKPDLDKLTEYVKAVHEIGKCASTEIITGMPYETRESHMKTIRDLVDSGFDFIDPFTFMLLDGIELDSEEAIRKFKYDIRYRLVPRNFGKIKGEYCFEIERVVVGTNTYGFDDYLYFRTFHYLLRILDNNTIYKELIEYLKQNGVHALDWLLFVFDDLRSSQSKAAKHFEEYVREARAELRDSPEELKAYYSQTENYQKLIRSEHGENLMQKYSFIAFSINFKDYTDYFFEMARNYLLAKYPHRKEDISKELSCIENFCRAKLSDVFTMEDSPKIKEFYVEYYIESWIKENFAAPLCAYKLPKPTSLTMELSDRQMKLIKDIFARYHVKDGNFKGLYKATAIIHANNYFRTIKEKVIDK
ncbi:MAG: radical SAM protein [Candidatus Omnitrophota bacterium]|nr:radical SAM protein [Candidatus Omnitrophota bacterium]